ncbi:hypothetical protein CM240_0409 [Clostridium bornimense]|uniref:Uncharacterized protein n=1 Tax=Clostridium bornimense TaxID=1216932 RepID=W6RSK7_9CLOT|nr:hypothetical protein [Clostridium bornimense]CDM67576.1 hypothetical protein CM240_0409 [Clostridium bornimense]
MNYNSNNYYNFSENDIRSLKLLDEQLRAQTMFIYSDYLSYLATIEGIQLIYSKYDSNITNIYNPDITTLQSIYAAIVARLMLADVAFTKYDILIKRFKNGEINFSLQPNDDINTANILSALGYMYALRGAQGIYERDISQPVFGI